MGFSFKDIFGTRSVNLRDLIPKNIPPPPPKQEESKSIEIDSETNNPEIKSKTMEKVNIKALPGTKMVPGKIYTVSAESAKVLIDLGRAVKATDNEKVGKIYKYPEVKKASDLTD